MIYCFKAPYNHTLYILIFRILLLYLRACSVTSVISDYVTHQALLVHGILQPMGVGYHALLQGILLTHELNHCLLCLLNCRWILYPLSHLESISFLLKGWIVNVLGFVSLQTCHIHSDLHKESMWLHAV